MAEPCLAGAAAGAAQAVQLPSFDSLPLVLGLRSPSAWQQAGCALTMSEIRVLESGLPPVGGLGSPPKMPVTLQARRGGRSSRRISRWHRRCYQAASRKLQPQMLLQTAPRLQLFCTAAPSSLQELLAARTRAGRHSRSTARPSQPGAGTPDWCACSPAHECGLAAARVGSQADHHNLQADRKEKWRAGAGATRRWRWQRWPLSGAIVLAA